MNQTAERFRSTADRPPEPVAMLDEFTNRVRAATAHASLVLDRLSTLGNRAFGTQPEAAGGSEAVGISREGAVDRAFLALNDLDAVLSRLEGAEDRVHGLA